MSNYYVNPNQPGKEMDVILNAAEKQLVIAIKNLLARNEITSSENIEEYGTMYFCSYKKSWNNAFSSLLEKHIIREDNNNFFIEEHYDQRASKLAQKHPRFRYWYNDWYRLGENSKAHSVLCKSAYGMDLCQTGMMTLKQIDYVAKIVKPNKCCLDLGCGSGKIAEYIADTSSSSILGVDIIAHGIKSARRRTRDKNQYLQFVRQDMTKLNLKNKRFDYIFSFDTIYFVGSKLGEVVENSLSLLNPEGKLLIFYSAWNPKDEALSRDSTALGLYLNTSKAHYECVDFTEDDREHWNKKYEALPSLKESFMKEDNMIIFENRLAEAEYFAGMAKENKLFRYLYIIG